MTDESKPTVPEVLPLVRAYYAKEGNFAGGSLHVVLDDGNISDDMVRACRDTALERQDADGLRIADLLLLMSKTQRHVLYRSDKRVPQ